MFIYFLFIYFFCILLLSEPVEHKCTSCDKVYMSKSALSNHMKTHNNEKPYKCTICNAGFTQKGSLNTHMANMHGSTHAGQKVTQIKDQSTKSMTNSKTSQYTNESRQPKWKKSDVVSANDVPSSTKKAKVQDQMATKKLKENKPKDTGKKSKQQVPQKQDKTEKLQCKICQKQFRKNKTLKIHILEHKQEQKASKKERKEGKANKTGTSKTIIISKKVGIQRKNSTGKSVSH